MRRVWAIACAVRSARRAWARARERQRRAALEYAAWEQLHELDERMLVDIGLLPGDLPWMAERDAFARLAGDASAWNGAFGSRVAPYRW